MVGDQDGRGSTAQAGHVPAREAASSARVPLQRSPAAGVTAPVRSPGRSPGSPGPATKLIALLATLAIVGGGLTYLGRYRLGLAGHRYAFLTVQPGSSHEPVTYDPCREISYVVAGGSPVQGGDHLLEQAVAEVSRLTGLRFVRLGLSRGGPSTAMVHVAWTDEKLVPQLAGDTVGIAGSTATRRSDGRWYYTTGEVNLDGPDLRTTLDRSGPEQVRAVIMHELGHLVGLDHVDDTSQLMHERNLGRTDFGPGDRQGLAALGGGGCRS